MTAFWKENEKTILLMRPFIYIHNVVSKQLHVTSVRTTLKNKICLLYWLNSYNYSTSCNQYWRFGQTCVLVEAHSQASSSQRFLLDSNAQVPHQCSSECPSEKGIHHLCPRPDLDAKYNQLGCVNRLKLNPTAGLEAVKTIFANLFSSAIDMYFYGRIQT